MTAKTNPARGATAVTPSDSGTHHFRSLYIGTTGNVSVVTENGDTVTFTAVAASFILPVSVTRVRSTGTTASNIVGLK